MNWAIARKGSAAFGLAIILLSMVGVFSYYSGLRFRDAVEWRDHTYQVLNKVGGMLADMEEAETRSRDFLPAGQDASLESGLGSTSQWDRRVDDLKALTSDNPDQQRRLDQLSSVIHEKLSDTKEAIELRKTGSLKAGADVLANGRSEQMMDRFRRLVRDMEQEEYDLLKEREAAVAVSSSNNMLVTTVGSFISIVLVLLAAVAVNRDLEGRNTAEREMRAARAYAEEIIATGPQPLLILTSDLRVKTANRSFYQTFQTSAAETENRLLYELGNGQWSRPDLRLLLEDIIPKKAPLDDFELNHEFPAIGRKTILLRARRLQADQTEFILVVMADITQRKEAEQKLRAASTEIRDLYNNAPCGYHSVDQDGTIVRINDTWLNWLGYTRDELVGKRKFVDLLTPESGKLLKEGFQEFKEKGRSSDVEFEFVRKDGTVMPALLNATWIKDEFGNFVMSRSTVFDMTEHKRTEDGIRQLNRELEASNKELEAFTYSISHDLRAPLRHIDGFSKLILEDHSLELSQEAKDYLSLIRGGAREMSQLVDDLLNLAQIGRSELSRELTGLNSLVEQAKSNFKNESEERGIEWRIQELPFAECDPNLMRQVFVNLISNAVKYSRPVAQPVIEVGTIEQHGQPVVFVRDNGVGFDMKHIGKLFGVFHRLHRNEDFEGTGVGLAIVQRIVQKHGGRVWADAELNKGAAFYFTLAASKKDPASIQKLEREFV